MSLPKYNEMYQNFLLALIDRNTHSNKDVMDFIISKMDISEEELELTLSSGQTVFRNHFGWCRTYLKKAGLITYEGKALYQITQDGIKTLNTEPIIDNEVLKKFPSFVEFISVKESDLSNERKQKNVTIDTDAEETPQETLERVNNELNRLLGDELLIKIHEQSPDFFEKLVIKLMEKMGYGTGKVTQRTRDDGIDGIVYQDKLGFDVIYIQAKRYDLDTKISRPSLQQFNGAIPDNGKGMFVTTAKFSADAIKYASDKHIILIDGQRLAQLMIDYDLGVSTQYVYKVKRIDTDCAPR